jgi:hypothetical protein
VVQKMLNLLGRVEAAENGALGGKKRIAGHWA